ncbi:pyridoxal phosphate-dependent decarboxylase family protein [Anaeromyxobacter oryzae]|uniref:L-2,4-diaminobutyrate decarboxylase n=1 Tax=Anaeromyxobacter oryzae TaxID=2918170 RepID=A0ABN6MZG8_9BACT|nr:pyridoxal-dependent decarboxylase [Anaeromyxobacter oryzae]BDG05118.1 L-2,4-diaminobutyrate decarboxylase [Anaeromyxobacter oryzae]
MSTPGTAALLRDAALRASRYLETIGDRSVAPSAAAVEGLGALDGPLPDGPADAQAILADLDEIVGPATMATAGPRFFGFVIGGALPATVAANVLATAWDQNSARSDVTPGTARIEAVALRWIVEALALPAGTAGGLVTGATLANFTALGAARHALLAREGWHVEARGLFGAPELEVVVGAEVHVSVLKALALLGLGKDRVTVAPTDGQGRIRADAFPPVGPRTIVCLQAGNVNSGSFDPAEALVPRARAGGAWVHVDGAFGLWARAAPGRAALARGLEGADSWATDLHKWLNVPYDSGIALVRDERALRAAMGMSAAYLPEGSLRDPAEYTPELSRRARGIEAWAALRALGRSGLAELVERNCRQARRFAEGLAAAGHRVLNDVVLNQVVVSFGDADRTRRVVAAIQRDGTCWCGGTTWQGHAAMRISVSSWATTDADVERSLDAMLRAAREA